MEALRLTGLSPQVETALAVRWEGARCWNAQHAVPALQKLWLRSEWRAACVWWLGSSSMTPLPDGPHRVEDWDRAAAAFQTLALGIKDRSLLQVVTDSGGSLLESSAALDAHAGTCARILCGGGNPIIVE